MFVPARRSPLSSSASSSWPDLSPSPHTPSVASIKPNHYSMPPSSSSPSNRSFDKRRASYKSQSTSRSRDTSTAWHERFLSRCADRIRTDRQHALQRARAASSTYPVASTSSEMELDGTGWTLEEEAVLRRMVKREYARWRAQQDEAWRDEVGDFGALEQDAQVDYVGSFSLLCSCFQCVLRWEIAR